MKTYVATSQKSLILKGNSVRMSNVIYMPIGGGAVLSFICLVLYIIHFEFFLNSFYFMLFDHVSFYFAPFDFVTIFILSLLQFVFIYVMLYFYLILLCFILVISLFVYFILYCCLIIYFDLFVTDFVLCYFPVFYSMLLLFIILDLFYCITYI